MKFSKRNLTPNILKKKKKMHIQNTVAITDVGKNLMQTQFIKTSDGGATSTV